jgi:hypothetical protein
MYAVLEHVERDAPDQPEDGRGQILTLRAG